MIATFARALPLILQTEGGFVNDPQDPGGATNLGVTIGLAKQLGLDIDRDGDVDVIDIKLLKPADAGIVYKKFYWDVLGCDFMTAGVDYCVCDFGVNSGLVRAAQFLQRIVGAKDDGHIGVNTLAALSKAIPQVVITQLSTDRLHFLERLPTWPHFGAGWKARVERVEATSLQMAAGA